MKTITNRHLFITMVIIGIITVALIIPLYNNRVTSGVSYDSSYSANDLGADVYNATYSGSPTNSILNINRRYPYIPVIQTSYPINTSYQYQYQTVPTTPTYKTYTYYTTTSNTDYGGYVPAGCEGGTDYSTTTGEPCG